jgi:cytochrome c556
MKKGLIVPIIILVLAGSATLWYIGFSTAKTGDFKNEIKDNSGQMAKPLPGSLDKWYPGEPIYLFKMFELGGSMMGVLVNTLQDDTTNAKIAYQIFYSEYEKSSKMVPEWKKYYDLNAVKNVGDALEAGDKEKTMAGLEVVFQTCGPCHTEMKTKVFAKYHWKDFNDVKMKTVNPEQPETSWKEAKAKYLVTGFDGTIVNARENQQEATDRSFQQFKVMFQFMKEACSSCHDTDRKYYVSDDVTALINTAEGQIKAGNLENSINAMEQIGGSCYKCHNTHEPLQRLKESVSTNKD